MNESRHEVINVITEYAMSTLNRRACYGLHDAITVNYPSVHIPGDANYASARKLISAAARRISTAELRRNWI